jgi:hypothetical protein
MVFSIDGLPSCIVSQTGKPCASEHIVYSADGPFCNDDSTATPPPPGSVQFRFPSLVTPADGEMCTGLFGKPFRPATGPAMCRPYAECWPDQDEFNYEGALKKGEAFSDYAYQSYFVLAGAKCENAKVQSSHKILIIYAKVQTLSSTMRTCMLRRCGRPLECTLCDDAQCSLLILHRTAALMCIFYCYSTSAAPLTKLGRRSSSTQRVRL